MNKEIAINKELQSKIFFNNFPSVPVMISKSNDAKSQQMNKNIEFEIEQGNRVKMNLLQHNALIPPQLPAPDKRKTLVLDLDNTLIYATTLKMPCDFEFWV